MKCIKIAATCYCSIAILGATRSYGLALMVVALAWIIWPDNKK